MMGKKLTVLTIVILTVMSSCSFNKSMDKANLTETTVKGTDDPADINKMTAGTYEIGIGDVLEIITWKEPDFSRDVPVRIDGKISFPLLDDIQAAGRTPAEVRDEISTRLKEYITHPVVSIAVKETGSQRFYIIGEVIKPGEYPIIKHLTLLQAFAIAGGFTEWAAKTDIILIRHEENGSEKIIKINYEDIVEGEGASRDVPLKADDTIVVP